jgi:hypothetical protein
MCSRRLFLFALAVAACSFAGCGGGVVPESGEEVQVTGKVPPPAGKSLSGFSIQFLTTGGKGRQATMPLSADGSFSGPMMKGKYSYSLVATKAPATEQALESFPDAYKKASLDRQIDVNGGEIALKF